MSTSIRLAGLDDEARILDLIEELFEAPGRRPADYSRTRGATGFRHAVQAAGADVLLAVAGGQVVGLASVYVDILSIRFGARCWLEDLVVTARRRAGGVGGLLLAAAADWGRRQGCTHLELNSAVTRAQAHRFYLAHEMTQDSLNFQLRL